MAKQNEKSSTSDDRQNARAPYNFIPLPARAVDVREQFDEQTLDNALPSHNVYRSDRRHGYFDVTLTTESPLYIRGPLTRSEAEPDQRDRYRNKPDFFHTGDPNNPVIPGSSLRGMIRSMVEIITWSKLTRLTQKQLFYRTVDDSVLGKEYGSRMTDKVEAGFISPGHHKIVKATLLRVARHMLGAEAHLYDGRGPNMTPRWSGGTWHQYMHVWVSTSDGKYVDDIRSTDPGNDGWHEGVLVLTGNMMKKKSEFVFLLPSADSEQIDLPQDMINRFHDDDQITQWQQKAFPQDKPTKGSRKRDGMLASTGGKYVNPVFFLRENKELIFFGRAGMFRLPYRNSPLSLIPDKVTNSKVIDFADAMFGFIGEKTNNKQGSREHAYSSRVTVTEARLTSDTVNPYESEITPPILGSPKPTAFQHYLVQPSTHNPKQFRHYDSAGTSIRGHKQYWRQRVSSQGYATMHQGSADPASTQHTRLKAVKPGIQFQFRVSFDNLTDIELGALAWVLSLGSEGNHPAARHMLGMGKSLGLGVVKLDTALVLHDRHQRYSMLLDDSGWAVAEALTSADTFAQTFVQFMTQELHGDFSARISTLIAMITVRNNEELNNEFFGTMSLEEFKRRSVLREPKVIAADYDAALNQQQEELRKQQDQQRKAERQMLGIQPGDLIAGEVFDISDGIWFTPDAEFTGVREYEAHIPADKVKKRREEGSSVKARVIEVRTGDPIPLICEQIVDDRYQK